MRVLRRRWLYVISHPDGLCKVGYSAFGKGRVQVLQRFSDAPLTLVHQIEVPFAAAPAAEMVAHARLKGRRVFGEWFRVGQDEACEAIKEGALSVALEERGAEFLNHGQPGVRLRARSFE